MITKSEKVLKALSDWNRLRIVSMLSHKPLCVCELTDIMNISQSTVSGHLRILKEAEIAEDKKDGLWVEYSLLKKDKFIENMLGPLLKEIGSEKVMKIDQKRAIRSDRDKICKR